MEYLYGIIIIVGLYVILATSFNLIIGYGGLISIAHPVFFALGAYTSAILSRDFGVPVLLAMLAGMLVAVVASIALALPSLRVSGDYLMIASIGFQLGILEVIKNLRFTGGPGGFTNIPPFLIRDFGRESYVLLVLVVMLGVIALVWWISRGDYGRAMSAMRDDELAFSSIGRDAMWMKIAIFAFGSGIAGFAGALYAHYFRYIAPEQFEILQSSAILTMVVVGGMRTDLGSGRRRAAAAGAAAGDQLSESAAERARPHPGTAVHRAGAGLHVLPAAGTGAGQGHLARRSAGEGGGAR